LTTSEALPCTECGTEYVLGAGDLFTDGTQSVYERAGRCRACRTMRRTQRGVAVHVRVREFYTVTCSGCGEPTGIPFQPRGDKPVYCSDCRSRKR